MFSNFSEFNPWRDQAFSKPIKVNEKEQKLVIWDDRDVSFNWMIKSLMEICKHSRNQAEQCALIIQIRGKYIVRKGTGIDIIAMCNALLNRGIKASIDI